MRIVSATRASIRLAVLIAFSIATFMALSPASNAQTTYGTGAGGALIDATSGDNPAVGVFTSDIIVNASAAEIIRSFNSVTLTDLTHTWLGDIDIVLTHVDSGASVYLTSPPENNAADLNGTYTFLTDSALQTLDQASSGLASNAIVGSGSYAISSYGDDGTNGPRESFSGFAGIGISGIWRLAIRDFSSGDTGTLGTWQFNATTSNASAVAPEPGSLALLGVLLPGMTMVMRRRRGTKK